jgi:hypothetical protein
MLKECLDPGRHWSMNRRFNPLWVLGIQLPGSYSNEYVDTKENIMAVVDSITPKILKEAERKMKEFFDGLARSKMSAKGFLYSAQSKTPTTAPPKCVTDLLCEVRNELSRARSESALISSLGYISVEDIPSAKLLAHLHEEITPTLSLLDEITKEVTDNLKAWHKPSMKLRELPALSTSDVGWVFSDAFSTLWDNEDREFAEDIEVDQSQVFAREDSVKDDSTDIDEDHAHEEAIQNETVDGNKIYNALRTVTVNKSW